LQDATPTLFGGLLALSFLLTCMVSRSDSARTAAACCCCALFGFDGCKLVYDVGIFLGCALALVRHDQRDHPWQRAARVRGLR
jgi:hypothetical protein